MDILIHLGLVFVIVILFFILNWSENPLIFGSILVFSSFGLIITLLSATYISTGEFQIIEGVLKETTISLGNWKYILNLSYIAFLISSIVYWTMTKPEKDEFDD